MAEPGLKRGRFHSLARAGLMASWAAVLAGSVWLMRLPAARRSEADRHLVPVVAAGPARAISTPRSAAPPRPPAAVGQPRARSTAPPSPAIRPVPTAGVRAPDADRPAPRPMAASPLEIGRELFARQWTPNDPRSHGGDGLGPVYNATSCLACHFLGGSGGAGPADVNVTLIVPGPEGFIPSDFRRPPAEFNEIAIDRPVNGPAEWERLLPGLREAPGVVLHHFGVDPSYGALRSALLELANDPIWKDMYEVPEAAEEKLAQRNTPPLFGAGLIDAVPDEILLHLAKRRHPSTIRGRVRRLKDGRIGRFGWKAQAATLDEFILGAIANELGLEVPGNHQAASPFGRAVEPRGLDLTRGECDALVAYIRSLPAPAARAPSGAAERAAIEEGRRAFAAVGCAECHQPVLGEIRGIYSDLLLHDVGTSLASSGEGYGGQPGQREVDPSAPDAGEWRTPPLWGVADSAPYLHDGRANTLEEAIAAHGGHATLAVDQFFHLPAERRGDVVAFLKSLVAPSFGAPAPVSPPALGGSAVAHPAVERWRRRIEMESAQEASQRLDRAAHASADAAVVKLQVAKSLEKIGKLQAALTGYREIASAYPGSAEARQATARIAAIEGKEPVGDHRARRRSMLHE